MSKISIVASQTEVLISHDTTRTLNTTIEDNYRQFITCFAVADIKHIIHGTRFFEEFIQSINTQGFILQFKLEF